MITWNEWDENLGQAIGMHQGHAVARVDRTLGGHTWYVFAGGDTASGTTARGLQEAQRQAGETWRVILAGVADGGRPATPEEEAEHEKQRTVQRMMLAEVEASRIPMFDPAADHEGDQTRALDGAGAIFTMPSEDGGPPWSVSFDCDEMIPLDEDEP